MSTGIGERVLRKEDRRLLNGQARFVGDIRLPRQWEAAFVRSPLAHGRIRSVTKPAGLEDRVFTAADLADVRPIRAESSLPSYNPSDQYPLARDKVRFVG
ncbi:MAG: xanthine dehydrogenase family protein molybdopterin-binding subunit, partial [Rhodobacteraceae bacterium]|nr:xanthine dehydrogenase family protein molybdopterin-binding subunit [Paracoccaceae bacterium]